MRIHIETKMDSKLGFSRLQQLKSDVILLSAVNDTYNATTSFNSIHYQIKFISVKPFAIIRTGELLLGLACFPSCWSYGLMVVYN